MNCREARPLLPLFFDGEIEARRMRAVALHSTRCRECEESLRGLERLQDALVTHVSSQLDEIDFNRVWDGVAPRLDSSPRSLGQRLADWWGAVDFGRVRHAPVYAALATACVLAILLWQRDTVHPPGDIASVDNSAILDSVQSDVATLAVLREPETNTLVLWITDDGSPYDEPAYLP